jgi:hypothetical protein
LGGGPPTMAPPLVAQIEFGKLAADPYLKNMIGE